MKIKKELLCPVGKLARGVMHCYDNAKQLVEDAKLLFKHKRYARAVALAIIALEEYGKSEALLDLTLPTTAKKGRNNKHHEKQRSASCEELCRTMKGKSQRWYHIADKSEFFNREKENNLYVDMDKGLNFKTPATTTKERAQTYIAFVARKIFEDWRNCADYKYVLGEIEDKRKGELDFFEEEIVKVFK